MSGPLCVRGDPIRQSLCNPITRGTERGGDAHCCIPVVNGSIPPGGNSPASDLTRDASPQRGGMPSWPPRPSSVCGMAGFGLLSHTLGLNPHSVQLLPSQLGWDFLEAHPGRKPHV